MVTSLPTRQRVFRGVLLATVNGIPTQILAADTQHGVNQPIGTCTIEVPLPAASQLQIAAKLEVQAGFRESSVGTIFSGRLIDSIGTIDDSGSRARFRAEGWASLLNFGEQSDKVFRGSSSIEGIVKGMCKARGVPMALIDRVTNAAGTQIRLGGNPIYDDGDVIIPREVSWLTWLDQVARLFEYRIFDTPSGALRFMRINGLPSGTPVGFYAEGSNAYRFERSEDIQPMITYWDVWGPRGTDNDGVAVQPHSFPASVPYDARLDPPGYRKDAVTDSRLVSASLATMCRQAKEVSTSAPYVTESWSIHGDPQREPGDIVQITSPTVGIASPSNRWLMSLRQSVSNQGYMVTMDGWAGAGTALPSGRDETSVTVRTNAVHLGDETISWYAQPSPSGTTFTIPITVPDTYTAIILSGRAHGSNSYLLDNVNTDSTVSKIEIWQSGKRVGSMDLPVLDENYESRLDYTNVANWSSFRVPISGQLDAGSAEVRIIAGEDRRLPDSTKVDDFEVRDLVLTLTGIGVPVLPGGA